MGPGRRQRSEVGSQRAGDCGLRIWEGMEHESNDAGMWGIMWGKKTFWTKKELEWWLYLLDIMMEGDPGIEPGKIAVEPHG